MEDEKVTVVEVPAAPSTPNKTKQKDAAGWFQLPVTTISKQGQGIKQHKLRQQSKSSMLLLSVQEILALALITACCACVAVTLVITAAMVLANVDIPCSQVCTVPIPALPCVLQIITSLP